MVSFKFVKFYPNGRREYYLAASKDGEKYGLSLYRKDGPAVITEDGTEEYYISGLKSKIIAPNGYEEHYTNGKLGRKEGPSIIYPTGGKDWYWKNMRHREDGPAREYPDGSVQYYYEDELIQAKDDKDFIRRVSFMKSF